MAQQTAVEWLLYNLVYHNLVDNFPKSKLWELSKQAKQMEKEQIKNAYEHGIDLSNYEEEWGEEYYNETYKNK